MSLLLNLSSILFVLLGSSLVFGLLRRIRDWSLRRTAQFFVLLMPTVILGVGMCSLSFSSRDILPEKLVLFSMQMVILGAVILGVIRLVFVGWNMRRHVVFSSLGLQELASNLAQHMGVARPCVRCVLYDRPLALTWGIFRPTVLLSVWMVEHLDRRELEAVLAHELEHVARHDYLVIWLATVLRDAFFYVPTSRVAYRQMQQEKEMACDDRTVNVTRRPLALASALAKVWQHSVDSPQFAGIGAVQSLVKVGTSIKDRIERLLVYSKSTVNMQPSRLKRFRMNTSALIIVAVVQGVNCIVVVLLMGCNPMQ